MTPVDRAFAIEQNKAQAKIDALKIKARRELPDLEIQLAEIREQAARLWYALCAAEGLTPDQIQNGERLFPSDENLPLAEKYDIVSKLLTKKLARYRVYCDLLGIVPNLKKIERGSQNNERHKSNVGESEGRSPVTQLRQPRLNHGRRVPRAHTSRNNKRK